MGENCRLARGDPTPEGVSRQQLRRGLTSSASPVPEDYLSREGPLRELLVRASKLADHRVHSGRCPRPQALPRAAHLDQQAALVCTAMKSNTVSMVSATGRPGSSPASTRLMTFSMCRSSAASRWRRHGSGPPFGGPFLCQRASGRTATLRLRGLRPLRSDREWTAQIPLGTLRS